MHTLCSTSSLSFFFNTSHVFLNSTISLVNILLSDDSDLADSSVFFKFD